MRRHRSWQLRQFSKEYNATQRLTLVIARLASLFIVGFVGLLLFYSLLLPSVNQIQNYLGPESTVIMDRNGEILQTISGDESRKFVPLAEIPQHMQDATLAIEDDQFYQHKGFDAGGIFKAVLSQIGIGKPRGGSTITQQLIKNTFLSSERTVTRKLKELILSTRLERRFTKDDILEMYLNQIPYGGVAYGVEQASRTYYNKGANELTLAEAATLAALPKAPSYYSPYGNHLYTKLETQLTVREAEKIDELADLADTDYTFGLLGQTIELPDGKSLYLPGRTDLVIERMEVLGFISEEQAQAAITESNNIAFAPRGNTSRAPHFVTYVNDLVEEQFGAEASSAGLRVTTSLDWNVQKRAEEIIAQNAQNNLAYGVNNLALVSIDNSTGHVLAMVGSADYFNKDINGFFNVFDSIDADGNGPRLQPGSSFKPFVYAQAMENGYGAGSVMWDARTSFGGKYPANYDGTFSGPVSFRNALGRSLNIPAIKAYYLAGEEAKITEYAENLGMEIPNDGDYNWTMALGTPEINPLELAHAYTAFPLNGQQCELTPILKVTDKEGNVLYEAPEKTNCTEKIDPQAAYVVTDILADQSVSIGPRLNVPGRASAAKTGTSNKTTPNGILPGNTWAIGYTPQITTAVWAGDSEGLALKSNASGYSNAAPSWQQFMIDAHNILDLPNERFTQPEGIKRVAVSKISGLLPNEFAPEGVTISDIFPSYGIPSKVDNAIQIQTVDIRNGLLPNEYCPGEFVQEAVFMTPQAIIDRSDWTTAINAWLNSNKDTYQANGNEAQTIFYTTPPAETSDLCTEEAAANSPSLEVLNLRDGSKVTYGLIPVEISADAPNGVDKVEYYFNNQLQLTVQGETNGTLRVSEVFSAGKKYPLRVKLFDEAGFIAEVEIEVTVVKEITDEPDPEEEEDEDNEAETAEDDQDNEEPDADDNNNSPIAPLDSAPNTDLDQTPTIAPPVINLSL